MLEDDPYLHALLEQIRPSILDISILQVAQSNGDGSEAHVQQLAGEWMADNADVVAGWREAAGTPRAEPEPPAALAPLGGDLTMCRANWASGYIQAEIVRQVLQSAGYTVSDPSNIELGPSNAYSTMAEGTCQFWANSWYPGHFSWYETS